MFFFTASWNRPEIPKDLTTYMADMSISPEIETLLFGDVMSIFKDSHDQMVNEIKHLIKDKMRMVNK